MARRIVRAVGFLLAILIPFACFVQATAIQTDGACLRLSLPEPDLVNAFLLDNSSQLNPLFGGNDSRPVQVVKCQRQWAPSFEFYQVQAPNSSCGSEFPPPVVTVEHPSHMAASGIGFWAFFILACISLMTGGSVAVVGMACLTVVLPLGICIHIVCFFWNEWDNIDWANLITISTEAERRRDEASLELGSVSLETDLPETDRSTKAEFEQAKDIVNSRAYREFLDRLMTVYMWVAPIVFLLVIFRAPSIAYRGTKDFLTIPAKVENLGPVPLPDPSQGLNQYLEGASTGVQLELCEKRGFNFYVGIPGGCSWVPDPYDWRRVPVEKLTVNTLGKATPDGFEFASEDVAKIAISLIFTGLMLVMPVIAICSGLSERFGSWFNTG